MVPFAGWLMPVQYTSILDEHKAVRTAAGLFDVSHMGEVLVEGPDAPSFINRLVTNDVRRLTDGRGLYAVMCYEDGGAVDDLIVYRIADDRWLLCINASNTEKDVEWMQGVAVGYNCVVRDVSADYGLLAVQGPATDAVMAALVAPGAWQPIPRFAIEPRMLAGAECLVSGTGYTGEPGYEIFVAAAACPALASALVAAGAPHGMALCGLGARDSLRLEAGYPLYGHELSADINPLEAGLGWVVKWNKPQPFVGQPALEAVRTAGLRRTMVYFSLEGRRIARQGDAVWQADRRVGTVCSGSLSPMTSQPIGSALIDANRDPTLPLEVDLRGNRVTLVCR
jgi:aminomethyltransferase